MPSCTEDDDHGPFDVDGENEDEDTSDHLPGDNGDTRDGGDGKTDEPDFE